MKINKLKSASSVLKQVITAVRRLLKLAWQMDKKITFLYYFTAAVGALVPVGASYVLKLLIDSLQKGQLASATTVSFTVALILIARYVISLLDNIVYSSYNQTYLDYVFRYKLQNETTFRFHQKISKLDIAYFEDSETQDLITKVRDTMQWRVPDFLRIFAYLFRDSVAYVAAFVVLISYGWWIPLVVTLVTLPRLYLKTKYGAVQWSIWGSGAPQVKKLWYFNHLLQDPTAVREIRIFQSADALVDKFKSLQEYLYDLNKKPLVKYLKVSVVPPLLEMIVLVLVSYKFLPTVLSGVMTIGTYTLLINMMEQLSRRSANASAKLGELYENSLYASHFFEFQSLPALIDEPEYPVALKDAKHPPKIEFRGVHFSYPNGPGVLKDVSFSINPGESVAFVGHNGAGKTTIIKLLCRFYDVTKGEILIDGVNIEKLDLSSWYDSIGTLFQEFVHYHFTVEENITLGDPDRKDRKAMVEAARKSGAIEFIKRFPNKYDQMLGKSFEDGEELSIGQWQKLAIARAFYEEPSVLILDEPTSAIDAKAEAEIFDTLGKQYKDRTLVLVSHRFSTVRNASKILVIEQGRLIERGSHDELMDLDGEYAELFTLQAKGYK